jgi:hypothetical protein
MSWAVAVCIDLTCVMAARERHRDQRTGRQVRLLSWPVVVLAAGVLLSLAANLDQAQPTAWGRIAAATPAAAFLVAVSMLERRASRSHGPVRDDQDEPVPAVVPVPSRPARLVPVLTANTSALNDPPDPELLGFARQLAADHYATHGTAITRDTLRARLGVSNQLASELLRQIRDQSAAKEDIHA